MGGWEGVWVGGRMCVRVDGLGVRECGWLGGGCGGGWWCTYVHMCAQVHACHG